MGAREGKRANNIIQQTKRCQRINIDYQSFTAPNLNGAVYDGTKTHTEMDTDETP